MPSNRSFTGIIQRMLGREGVALLEEFQAERKSLSPVQVAQNAYEATPSAPPTAAPGIPLGQEEGEKEALLKLMWLLPVPALPLGFSLFHLTLTATWHGLSPLFRDEETIALVKMQSWDVSPETLVSEVHALSHLSHHPLRVFDSRDPVLFSK